MYRNSRSALLFGFVAQALQALRGHLLQPQLSEFSLDSAPIRRKRHRQRAVGYSLRAASVVALVFEVVFSPTSERQRLSRCSALFSLCLRWRYPSFHVAPRAVQKRARLAKG
jgi:hypothetical protein